MSEPTMRLVDIHGAFAGQERDYAVTAGEVALATGFARRPGDPDPNVARVEERAALPEDFPGREALVAVGIEALDAVPRTRRGLTALPGVGRVIAMRILEALGVEE